MRRPLFELIIITAFMASVFTPFATGEEWKSYTVQNSGIGSNCISGMAISESGMKWFGHGDSGTISRFNGVSWDVFPLPNNLPLKIVNDIAVSGETVWVATDYGVCSFNGIAWQTYFTDFFRFKRVEVDQLGCVWVTGWLGPWSQATISMFDGMSWVTWLLKSKNTPMFAFDSTNALWLITEDFTMYRYLEPKWKQYAEKGFTTSFPFIADRDTTLWFADGMSFDGVTIQTDDRLTGAPIGADGRNTVWYSTGRMLQSLDQEKNTITKHPMTEALQYYESIRYGAIDRDGSIWLHSNFDVTVGVRHFIPDNPAPSFRKQTPVFSAASDRSTSQPNGAAMKYSVDFFPLDVGNIWIYEREFTSAGQYRPVQNDHLVLTVIDTVKVDNRLWSVFLDGTMYRKDDQDKVYSESGLLYDFSQPQVDNYSYSSIYSSSQITRTNTVFNLPLGDITGYSFGFFNGTSKNPKGIAPGIGMVFCALGSSIGEQNTYRLEYARIGGREYGIRTAARSQPRPDTFRVYPPAPNPFNPSTAIRIELGAPERVQIAIYTITGQKVATLCDTPLAAGSHVFTWKPEHCAAGLYLYSARADGQVRTGKMLLLK